MWHIWDNADALDRGLAERDEREAATAAERADDLRRARRALERKMIEEGIFEELDDGSLNREWVRRLEAAGFVYEEDL